ncbi:hypothetical protein [Sphingobacterium bambusae]|uniref:Uncharacterized protein n=1 Tax=Sphingobacterium bambusae TaxID=662858 RepID=A0ABW6BKT6_9SPHI|nr:hypothetical protein [Sphingobacterium bambusae]WPL49747.1 hypothetical protein SCB77_04680 [Sphingobacterium bambusae]
MGILDFFKKRKQEEFAEPKSEHVEKVEDTLASPNADDNERPTAGNTFKVPVDAVPAEHIDLDTVETIREEHKQQADSTEETLDGLDKEVIMPYAEKADQAVEEAAAAAEESTNVPEAPVEELEKIDEAETDDRNPNDVAYLGNLAHTAVIDQLLRVPREERNDEWVGNFLTHVGTASFVCGDPQVIQGPDNFPYFQLFIPEANKPFQCYVLDHMLDDFLLDNGLGVALEPKAGEVEWVLSYGDLLHYSVHRTFAIPSDHLFGRGGEGDETITADEQVLVGAPSELILPLKARGVIREFLKAQGIQEPKVCLMDRSTYGKGQDLVFNLTPWQFETEAHYRAVMQALGWFLPRYYSYTGAEERTFQSHFLPL